MISKKNVVIKESKQEEKKISSKVQAVAKNVLKKPDVGRTVTKKTISGRQSSKKLSEVSRQENCILFKLPAPVLMDLLLFAFSSGKMIITISLCCKKLLTFLFTDPRPWLLMIIENHPNLLGSPQVQLEFKQRLNDGFKDTTRDWKNIYIQAYIKYISEKHKKLIKNIIGFINSRNTNGLRKISNQLRSSKISFINKNNRLTTKIPLKSITYFPDSLIVAVSHKNPVNTSSSLEIEIYGTKIAFDTKTSSEIRSGTVALMNNNVNLSVLIGSEIYTEYWMLTYIDIGSKIAKYKPPVRFDDISNKFGLRGYQVMIDIHNLTETLANVNERCFDLVGDRENAIGQIHDLKIVIPKDKMFLNWTSLAFSEKIKNFAIVDFVIYSEFIEPIIWGSGGGCLTLAENSSNYGDGYSLSILKENIRLTLYFREKGKNYILTTIEVDISMQFISQQFVSSR